MRILGVSHLPIHSFKRGEALLSSHHDTTALYISGQSLDSKRRCKTIPDMAHSLTRNQLHDLETTERIASCFSLVGTTFIFVTFVYSPAFRKPVNRLIFYASWGNTLCNIATLMSQAPVRAGPDSHLCQFQGFLIQM